jgi:hypothetical protein
MTMLKSFGWVVATVGLGAMLYLFASDEPKLPIAVANGSFSNAEIGTIVLRDGQLKANGHAVPYVVETDKVGPYVLPTGYVGVSERRILVNRGSAPLKLRLDHSTQPRHLGLHDVGRNALISFERVYGS